MVLRKFISKLSFFLLFLQLFNSSGFAQSNRMKDRFYLGPFNIFYDLRFRTTSNIGWYSELSYNMMHNYCSHIDYHPQEWGTTQFDGGFFEPTPHYQSFINTAIGDWYGVASQNSLIFEREKITRGCYGQRSTYKAINPGSWSSVFPGYGYQYTSATGDDYTDNTPMGGGAVVRRCIVGQHSKGFIVKDLYENMEQVNNIDSTIDNTNFDSRRLWSDVKEPQYNMKWFIKPRMRIDSVYAKNNPNDTVCKLYVKRFDGQLLDSFCIKCDNFIKYYNGIRFYDGRYIEMYYNIQFPQDTVPYAFSVSSWDLKTGRIKDPDNLANSQVDYYIKWWGKVDTYLEYVRLDDSWAHYLFTDTIGTADGNIWKFYNKIDSEVVAFTSTSGFGYFWVDEIYYNNIPCAREVNRLVKKFSNNNSSIVISGNVEGMVWSGGLRNTNFDRSVLVDSLIRTGLMTNLIVDGAYPYYYSTFYPPNVQKPDDIEFPATKLFNQASTLDEYNYGTTSFGGIQGSLQYNIDLNKKTRAKAKEYNLPYCFYMQVHSDEGNIPIWGLREPTNEEISALCNIGLALGSQQIFQYSYYSGWLKEVNSSNKCIYTCDGQKPSKWYYTWGLVDLPTENGITNKRVTNYYGQSKWSYVETLNQKLRNVGDYIYPQSNPTKFLKYDTTISINKITDNNGELQNNYIKDIKSKVLTQEFPISQYYCWDGDLGAYVDCKLPQNNYPYNSRFWEIGYFTPNPNNGNQYDKSKYFMAVNKRCTPVSGDYGENRELYIKFNKDFLLSFNNWKLIDALTDNTIITFNKDLNQFLDAGTFQPGEGKLFKLVPVMQNGGNLICNESFSGQTFTNESVVYGNGYNINIGGNNTISFKSSGGIQMYGGTFICGTKFANQPIVLQGDNGTWLGMDFQNCSSVIIKNTTMQNIYSGEDFHYGINIIGCNNIVIYNNHFISTNSAGFANISLSENYNTSTNITYNNINCGQAGHGISVMSYGGSQTQVYILNNTIYSSNVGSEGIILSNISGGVISTNTINNFVYGINLLSSSADIYGNTIYCGINNSIPIYTSASSNTNLSSSQSASGTTYIGGSNNISNTNGNNIYSANSIFYLDRGHNIFSISSNSYNHLTGWFPSGGNCDNDEPVPARDNCFFVGGNINPLSNVTCGYEGNTISFDFTNTNINCPNIGGEEQYEVISLGEDINDTLWSSSQGSSGGEREYTEGQAHSLQITSAYKILKDSICITLRKRNFELVEAQCTRMLNQYPDSLFSLDALSKLYLVNLKSDSAGNKISPLKTYYETLILNNSSNYPLISRANYLVQKCKVVLKQYTSALQGFQEIINQNPYSYEGLIASWDYAATSLLAGSSGGYGNDNMQLNESEANINIYTMLDTLRNKKSNAISYIASEYDNTKFTVKDRETIKSSIENMYKDERSKQIAKLQELEKNTKSENETKKTKSINELKTMKTFGEVIKVKKPNTINEHIINVNRDLKKVLGLDKLIGDNKTTNTVPITYSLSQNYPNPFNPVTKINYELPKDGKVKLVIFDILGREIKSLVNNEFKQAGRYTVEFNGTQFASGVYFYRIQVEGGSSYTAVKKMVLLK
jgi:hypothetical protein